MVTNDDANHLARKSHLFTLRLWLEDLGSGQSDWRGKVQHVNSGDVCYFQGWPSLLTFLEGKLLKTCPEGRPVGKQEGSNIV